MVDATLDRHLSSEETRASTSRATPLQTLLPFVVRYKGRLLLALLFLVVSTLASLAIPAVAGNLVQQGFIERNLTSVGAWSWTLLAIAAVIAIGSGARFYFVASLGERIVTDLRQAVFTHLLMQDVAFYDTHRIGELTSRLGSDVAAIRGVVGTTLTITIRAAITVVGSLFMMLSLNLPLALAIVVGGPIAAIPILGLTRRLRRMSRRAQDAVAELSALATEMLGANRTVKSFTQEDRQGRRYYSRGSQSLEVEQARLIGRAVVIAAVMMMAAGVLIAVVSAGSHAVLSNEMTVGQLAQFLIYALMAASAASGVAEIAGSLQTMAGATERLTDLLNTRAIVVTPAQPLALPSAPTKVTFEAVTFRYAAVDRPALSDLCFSIEAGRTYAVVGASGAGKSTILALMQRFYDVGSGSIRFDGVDVRHVDLLALRRRIAAVEQDPTIFAGTIADNLRFGRADASAQEIEAAAQLALVTEFTQSLPAGLDTMVGERGVRLSGGQRQRIAIGRAIVKNAPILLLDEATSALDAANERLVRDALAQLRKGRTTLVIAHRLSTVRDADEIFVLDKGRIVERGSHNALFAASGVYRKLVRLQTST
jgi:ATP-binding cassette subfamily B protein